jgi:hypothetical protein
VFLAATPELAVMAAANLIPELDRAGFLEPMALLEVVLPTKAKLFLDEECYGEDVFYTTSRIPPSNISLINAVFID